MKNILLVDDDAVIRRIAEITLTRIGNFNVKTSDSGANAIETLKTFIPDLIILDVMMPDLDGPTTFCKIKMLSHCADIPVVFMTAKVQKHEVQSYNESGVAGVIIKPFDPVTLSDEVRELYKHATMKKCVA